MDAYIRFTSHFMPLTLVPVHLLREPREALPPVELDLTRIPQYEEYR